jgi:hypothetical protein
MKQFILAAATALTLTASLGAASAQSMNTGQIAPDRPGEFFSDAHRSGMKIGG